MTGSDIQHGGDLSGAKSCPDCGRKQDDFQRDIYLRVRDELGNETTEPARALFDTGTECDNLIDFDFAQDLDLGDVEWNGDVKEKRSLKNRLICLLARLFGKHNARQPPAYRTVDGSPIEIAGVLTNTRWRGENRVLCTPGISFQNKFYAGTKFLIIKNLAFQVIISKDTMNDLKLRNVSDAGPVCAGFIARKSTPESLDFRRKQQEEKKKQEQKKKDLQSTSTPSTGSTPSRTQPTNPPLRTN